jgi:hypothetical protein
VLETKLKEKSRCTADTTVLGKPTSGADGCGGYVIGSKAHHSINFKAVPMYEIHNIPDYDRYYYHINREFRCYFFVSGFCWFCLSWSLRGL